MKNKKKFLKRRQLLVGATALTAAAGLLASCKEKIDGGTPENPGKSTSISKGIIQWKMITCWPRDFPGGGTQSQKLAKRITESSGGKLEVKTFCK